MRAKRKLDCRSNSTLSLLGRGLDRRCGLADRELVDASGMFEQVIINSHASIPQRLPAASSTATLPPRPNPDTYPCTPKTAQSYWLPEPWPSDSTAKRATKSAWSSATEKKAPAHFRCELEILLAAFAIGEAEREVELSINVSEIGAEGEVGDGLRTAKSATAKPRASVLDESTTHHLLVLLHSKSQAEGLSDLVQREDQLVLRRLCAPLVVGQLPTAGYDSIEVLHHRFGGALEIAESERSVDLTALNAEVDVSEARRRREMSMIEPSHAEASI